MGIPEPPPTPADTLSARHAVLVAARRDAILTALRAQIRQAEGLD